MELGPESYGFNLIGQWFVTHATAWALLWGDNGLTSTEVRVCRKSRSNTGIEMMDSLTLDNH